MKKQILSIMLCLSMVIVSMGKTAYAWNNAAAGSGDVIEINTDAAAWNESEEAINDGLDSESSSDTEEDMMLDDLQKESESQEDASISDTGKVSPEKEDSYAGDSSQESDSAKEDGSDSQEKDVSSDTFEEDLKKDFQVEPHTTEGSGDNDEVAEDGERGDAGRTRTSDPSEATTETGAVEEDSDTETEEPSLAEDTGDSGSEIEITEEPVFYDDVGDRIITYTVSGNEATITGCSGSVTALVIPETLDGFTVTNLDSWLFQNNENLKIIVLPKTIKTIGSNAFYNCENLEIVKLNYNSTTTETESGEELLHELVIGDNAFYGCTSLKEINLTENVTRIESYAFQGCKSLTSLALPERVTSLGSYMIAGTGITKMTVPKNVKYADSALRGATSLKEVIFEEEIETIPSSICYEAYYITEVSIPESVREIESYAFYSCTRLRKAVLNYNSTTTETESGEVLLHELAIGYNAFYGCTSLEEINLTENVTKIESSAFQGCKALTSLVLPERVTSLGSYMIAGTGIAKITVPKNVKYADSAFRGAISLKEVIFEEGIETIPSSICYEAYYITEVNIPESVREIESYAFYSCTRLRKAVLNYNSTTTETESGEVLLHELAIGYNAFYGCTSLEEINLTENVTKIESSAFQGCKAFTNLMLPERVTSLGSYMIAGTGIAKMTVPKNVKYADSAFRGATSLKEVVFEDGIETIPSSICYEAYYITEVSIPESVREIESYAFNSCSYIEKAVIPASVNEIGDNAFYNCSNLTIYGVTGSYAQTYANLNGIPFVDISTLYGSLYRNTDYSVKVVNGETGKALSGATVTVDGKSVGRTGTDGVAKFTVYGTATQKVGVSRDGFVSVSYQGMPWESTRMNTVALQPEPQNSVNNAADYLAGMMPSTNLGSATVSGPEITVAGHSFKLFETEMSFDVPFFDGMTVKNDPEKKTVQVMLGLEDSYAASIKAAGDNDVYWSKSYQEVKSLVKACGGRVDTPRLWNRFSSMRGKLKKINGNAAFGVSGSATGFMEFSYADGNLRLVDSGLAANLSGNAKLRAYWFYVIYAEFGFEVGVDGNINLTLQNQTAYALNGSLGVSIAPRVAVGADLKVLDAQAGIIGTLDGSFKFPASTMRDGFELSLTGEIYIKIASPIPFLNASKTFARSTMELYPEFGAFLDGGDWNLAIEDRVVPGDGESYEYADTQVVSLSDGRKVKVFITDDGTKTTGNHTTLMYSVYSDGEWSTAAAVRETGHADCTPVLRADGENAYVLWMNIGKTVTDGMEAGDIYPYADIYLSRFSGTGFEEPMLVPASGNRMMEFAYSLAVSGGRAAVAWVENSNNDPFMESGMNSVYLRVLGSDGKWQDRKKLATSIEMVMDVDACLDGQEAVVSYSNGSRTTTFTGSVKAVTESAVGMKYFGGTPYFLKEGQLFTVRDGQEAPLGILCGQDYQVFDGKVYWTLQEGFGSEVYVQPLDGGTAVRLTRDGGFISSFTVYKGSDGAVRIDYVLTELTGNEADPYGASVEKTYVEKTVVDLAFLDVSYDAAQARPGADLDMLFRVASNSTADCRDVSLLIQEGGASYRKVDMFDVIHPGEEKEFEMSYALPENLAGKRIVFNLVAEDDDMESFDDKTFTLTFDEADLVITGASAKEVSIRNQGYAAAKNTVIEVREGSSSGDVIAMTEAGTVAAGASVKKQIEIPAESLKFEEGEDEKLFFISVSSSTPEIQLGDNDITLRVEAPRTTGIALSAQAEEVAVGKRKKLSAEVESQEGAQTGVEWNSSDVDIVKVEEDGTILGVSEGEADVTAVTKDTGLAATCHVTVTASGDLPNATGIAFTETEKTITVGSSALLEYTVLPESGQDLSGYCFWKSDDESVATVEDGTVTGISPGTAVITLEILDCTAACVITVEEETVPEFSLYEIVPAAYNKLKLTWTKCQGADGYLVYRKSGSEEYAMAKGITDPETTELTNAVTSGVKYTYKMAAYRLEGSKKTVIAESEERSATALPAPPVMKSVGMAAYNKIKVIWTKVSGCAGYVIYRSTEKDGKYSVLKTVTMATATEYSNIVQEGKTYYYKIRAFVEVNGKKVYGNYSEAFSGDVIDAPPANFRLEQKTATKIVFSWDKVEDSEGYVVYRYFPDTNKCKAVKNITSNDTLSYSFKAEANTAYQFAMRAFRVVNGKKVYSDYTGIISN